MYNRIHIATHLIRRTMGSRRGILLNIILPAILLAVIGGLFAGSSNQKAVILLSNQDQGILGESIANALKEENIYDVSVAAEASEQDIMSAVKDGKADAAVFIPADFTEQLIAGQRPQAVLYRMNEQLWNASLVTRLEAEANQLASAVSLTSHTDQGFTSSKLEKLLEAEELNKVSYVEEEMKLGKTLSHPEMIGIMLMFVMLLVSQSIGFVMEDREQRTMARMYAAPTRSIDIAIGNFMGSMLVGTFQLLIVLSLTYYGFGFMHEIPFGSLLLVLECFLLAAVGLASLIGGLVKNSAQLGQINNLFITPSCMISGCFWPLSMMPEFMQKLANFTPQKWAIQAVDRLGGGGTIADIWLQLSILLLFAVMLIAFGAAVLRPSQASR